MQSMQQSEKMVETMVQIMVQPEFVRFEFVQLP